MLNLFLDLRNTNFDDEQTLNFKCFTVNKLALDTNLTLTTVKSSVFWPQSRIALNWYTYIHDPFCYSNHQPRHNFSGAQQLSLLHFSSVFF